MIKAVIFDLNGVFIQSPYLSDRFEEKFGVSAKEFLPALREIMARVREPNAEDTFNYWRPYLKKWGVNLIKEKFFDFWFCAEKKNSEMVEIAKRIKKRNIKLFILSNNFKERADYYKQKISFLEEIFDRIYYSWQTGFIKPNLEAYKKILRDNNLQPKECLYFDDLKENIEVANSLGINSFLFKGISQTEEVLKCRQVI